MRLTCRQWLLLVLAGALFLALRLRWLDHLLVWDEAMTVCTMRSFVAGVQDHFSNWFWRHPPLHHLLMAFLVPQNNGFIVRAELLSIFINLVSFGLLFVLNRRVFGERVAMITLFVLAILPGGVFFDVWIKEDHLALLFGLLALLAQNKGWWWRAGMCLGLSVLCKETALFFILAANILCVSGMRRDGLFRNLVRLNTPLVFALIGWYGVILPLVNGGMVRGMSLTPAAFLHGAWEHIRFGTGIDPNWHHPWHYYLEQLSFNLGWAGVFFSVTGIIVLLARWWAGDSTPAGVFTGWPLLVILPAFILLSCLPSKVPWVTIILLPAWASIIAIACEVMVQALEQFVPLNGRAYSLITTVSTGVVIVTILLTSSIGESYESRLRKIDESQWRGASRSKAIATVVNRHVRDGDRMLLTSFHYWSGLEPGRPCPIFTCYFNRNASVLTRSHTITADDVCRDARRYKLDWALLSPDPGANEKALFSELDGTWHLPFIPSDGAYLFDTRSLKR